MSVRVAVKERLQIAVNHAETQYVVLVEIGKRNEDLLEYVSKVHEGRVVLPMGWVRCEFEPIQKTNDFSIVTTVLG